MPNHAGKIALVAGEARDIGAAIAHRLGSEGARVVIFDIEGRAGGRGSGSSRRERWKRSLSRATWPGRIMLCGVREAEERFGGLVYWSTKRA